MKPSTTRALPAEAVARYFLLLAAQDEEALVTQMQLHKLLYYAQGWSLATRGRILFEGKIEAWMHGPVVKDVHKVFANFRNEPISPDAAADSDALSGDDRAFITAIWTEYGRYSAAHLRRMTHQESPWKNARVGVPDDVPSSRDVSLDDMREYFNRLRERECGRMGLSISGLAASFGQYDRGELVEFPPAVGGTRSGRGG